MPSPFRGLILLTVTYMPPNACYLTFLVSFLKCQKLSTTYELGNSTRSCIRTGRFQIVLDEGLYNVVDAPAREQFPRIIPWWFTEAAPAGLPVCRSPHSRNAKTKAILRTSLPPFADR